MGRRDAADKCAADAEGVTFDAGEAPREAAGKGETVGCAAAERAAETTTPEPGKGRPLRTFGPSVCCLRVSGGGGASFVAPRASDWAAAKPRATDRK